MLLHDSRRAAREQEGELVLLRRLGRNVEARTACQRALALVHDEAGRRLLERRLADLAGPLSSGGTRHAPGPAICCRRSRAIQLPADALGDRYRTASISEVNSA